MRSEAEQSADSASERRVSQKWTGIMTPPSSFPALSMRLVTFQGRQGNAIEQVSQLHGKGRIVVVGFHEYGSNGLHKLGVGHFLPRFFSV